MAKNIHITRRPDKQWQGIGEGNTRPYFVAETQKEASRRLGSLRLNERLRF